MYGITNILQLVYDLYTISKYFTTCFLFFKIIRNLFITFPKEFQFIACHEFGNKFFDKIIENFN